MKKILVPVDFSETSENALLFACSLFGSSAVEITLLHIYGTQSTALLMKSIDGFLIKDAKEKLNALVEKVKDYKVHLKIQLAKNYPVQSIVTLGKNENYDYIIMGTKGASGLKEVFLGSVAGGVIAKTKIPVIVIPTAYTNKHINTIVFAVNDIELLKSVNLEPLHQLAKINNSRIEILQVAEKQSLELSEALKEVKSLDAKVSHIYGSGNINKDINDYLIKNNARLLCLIRGKKDYIDRLFSDSVTLKQTFNSPIPLIILHE
ncbi:universal stress protein [Winogradskyella luteola]|uniref:Universal stress protein n=1 Tax=Winogradskyella luteola TaxID=2828330 RepID=A0A9X1FCT1_9FLAO|nr:universal stress protein [Winogradskyella luteola]MBV7270633.1 universal stress protein [Winogradskyella luteola]